MRLGSLSVQEAERKYVRCEAAGASTPAVARSWFMGPLKTTSEILTCGMFGSHYVLLGSCIVWISRDKLLKANELRPLVGGSKCLQKAGMTSQLHK